MKDDRVLRLEHRIRPVDNGQSSTNGIHSPVDNQLASPQTAGAAGIHLTETLQAQDPSGRSTLCEAVKAEALSGL